MILISEVLLDVVSFLDYSTTVLLRLTNKQLLRFGDRYAVQLAFRRTFAVYFIRLYHAQAQRLSVVETRSDNSRITAYEVDLDVTATDRLVGAMAELHSLIGPHAVREVFLDNITFSVKLLVDRVPELRHASVISLNYGSDFSPSLREYTEAVCLFERPAQITFREIPTEALAVFLQSDCASQLRRWSVLAPQTVEIIEFDAAMEEVLFRRCFDFTYLGHLELKTVSLVGWNLCWDFLRRLIEAADTLQRVITIEISKPDWLHPERLQLGNDFAVNYWRLPLDPVSFEEKSVAIGNFLQHRQHQPNPWIKIAYFSKRSDLAVFVRGDVLTITNNSLHIYFAAVAGIVKCV